MPSVLSVFSNAIVAYSPRYRNLTPAIFHTLISSLLFLRFFSLLICNNSALRIKEKEGDIVNNKMKSVSVLVFLGILLSADSMIQRSTKQQAYTTSVKEHSFARAGSALLCPKLAEEASSSAHEIAVTSVPASTTDLVFQDYYANQDCVVHYDPSTEADGCLLAHVNDPLYCAAAGIYDNIPWSYCLYYDREGQPHLGYIETSCLTESGIETQEYDIPSYSGFKSYMGYDKITAVNTPAYQVSRRSTPDENGLMTYQGRYLIAVGMYFDVKVGDYLDLTLANGNVLHCIVGDRKAMAHTDSIGLFTAANHCMSEFIVSENVLNPVVRKYGNVSYINQWNSPVVHVTTFRKNCLEEAVTTP